LPSRIKQWSESITGDKDERTYPELCDQFLCQGTITDAAYAVIPYIVQELRRINTDEKLSYLVTVAAVEQARVSDDDAPELPADLKEAYEAAIKTTRGFAVECLKQDWPKIEFRFLMSVIASVHGHGGLGEILFNLDCACGTCPTCDESVYPEEIQESGYIG
jgi:hypothetical protein